jgi:membrane protein
VPAVPRALAELRRVELLDRSLALGAQALLALIPMLMVLGAVLPQAWVQGVLGQIRDVVGLRDDVMEPLKQMALTDQVRQAQTGIIGFVISLASASSFSRALQRMYARAWQLPGHKGVRALRSSLVWILGWLLMLQVTALLLKSLSGVPHAGPLPVLVQLTANTLLWWWTSRLLLGGRVSWRGLLPGACLTAVLVVSLTRLSSVFMPPFTRSNLQQFGPLGVVFALGSWLVVFGGVLVVATVVGRQLALWWAPEQVPGQATQDQSAQDQSAQDQAAQDQSAQDQSASASVPTGRRRLAGLVDAHTVDAHSVDVHVRPGLAGRDPAGEEHRPQRQQGKQEQRRPQAR